MRSQINPAIDPKVKQLLLKTAKKRGVSYGNIVESALNHYFNPDFLEQREKILYRRLDQMNRKQDNLSLEVSVFAEAFLLFVRTYLGRVPEVPEEQKKALKAQSAQKFQQFLVLLSENVSLESSIVNYLPKDTFTAEEERVLSKALSELNESSDAST